MTYDQNTRLKAKELLFKSRIYRLFGMVFAIVGIMILAYLYHVAAEGDPMAVLQNIASIGYILMALTPAIFFSFLANRAHKKLYKLLSENKEKDN